MRDFFKYTAASFLALLLFVSMGVGGLIFLIISIATSARDTGPRVENKTVLAFDLSTPITDSAPEVNPGDFLGDALAGGEFQQPISLRTVIRSLEAAATDDRIVGLYLYGNLNPATSPGLAALGEIRQALVDFQESGKPIMAYDLGWAERDYYLVSVADPVVLNPSGALEINGFSSELAFLAGTFDQYGIGIQVVRAGRYKSAVEPLTQTERSPEEEEQTRELLTDLWTEFRSTVSTTREVTSAQLQSIADTQGLLLAEDAQARGLVDQIGYFEDVLPDLLALTEEGSDSDTFRQVSLTQYADIQFGDGRDGTGRNQIALVYAEGEIVSGQGDFGQIGGDRLADQIRRLRLDDDVKAIVLRVNSPGGSATASERVAHEVELASEAKPVIVSMGSFAASGGYFIATYADQIFASPTTITGSIGVYGVLPNFQEIGNNNGITWDVIQTAELANIDTISRPKTEAELAVFQNLVDSLYDRFLSSVAESRNLSREQLETNIAAGRVWSGSDAQDVGLVDEIGGMEAAIAAAANLAELEDDWYIEEYPRPQSLEEQLIGNLFSQQHPLLAGHPLGLELQNLQEDVALLLNFNDPLHVYTRIPFNLRID
jgi:protease-4